MRNLIVSMAALLLFVSGTFTAQERRDGRVMGRPRVSANVSGRHAFPANSVERGALTTERGSTAAMDTATGPLAVITAHMATGPPTATAVIPAIGS